MRLVSFRGGFGRLREDGHVIPMGPSLIEHLSGAPTTDGEAAPLDTLELLSPVPSPGKVVGIGLNYRDHCEETGQPVPERPVLFAKFASSVIGPGAAVSMPADARKVDYEAELAFVIGRRARRVNVDDAMGHVAGYTCANDVSARDLQFDGGQWTRGKAVDTFLPLGPWLVTPDELEDPHALAIRCRVNGEVRQDSNTDQMVFGVSELVSFISRTLTLEPGDVVITGTPPGVGFTREPPLLLADGDEVTVEIEGIGSLTNPIRAERPFDADADD